MLISAGIRFIFLICHVGPFEELCHIPVDQARTQTAGPPAPISPHISSKVGFLGLVTSALPLKARRPGRVTGSHVLRVLKDHAVLGGGDLDSTRTNENNIRSCSIARK